MRNRSMKERPPISFPEPALPLAVPLDKGNAGSGNEIERPRETQNGGHNEHSNPTKLNEIDTFLMGSLCVKDSYG